MATSRFHVTPAGEAGRCEASKKPCPYGTPEEHFPTLREARQAAEAHLASRHAHAPLRKVKQAVALAQALEELPPNPTPEELQRVGALLLAEVDRRLPPALFTKPQEELTREELAQAAAVAQEELARATGPTGDLPVIPTGPRRAEVREAASLLPSGALDHVARGPLITSTLSSKRAAGQHVYGHVRVGQVPVTRRSTPNHDLPPGPGVYFSNEFFVSEDLHSPYSAMTISRTTTVDGEVEQLWLGERISHHRSGYSYKKIADGVTLHINGRAEVVRKPLYELTEKTTALGTELRLPKPTGAVDSIPLHELTHAVQNGRRMQQGAARVPQEELAAFEKFAGVREYNYAYREVMRSGLPHEYMGEKSGVELFPVATEGLLMPHAPTNSFFYGGDRHPQADGVRAWVAGYWLHLHRRGESRRKASKL